MPTCHTDTCSTQVKEIYSFCDECKALHYPASGGDIQVAIQSLKQWARLGHPSKRSPVQIAMADMEEALQ